MRQTIELADLARLMAEGYTVRAAATELHVHENTVYETLRRHGCHWWPVGTAAVPSRLRRIAARMVANSERAEARG